MGQLVVRLTRLTEYEAGRIREIVRRDFLRFPVSTREEEMAYWIRLRPRPEPLLLQRPLIDKISARESLLCRQGNRFRHQRVIPYAKQRRSRAFPVRTEVHRLLDDPPISVGRINNEIAS